MNFLIHKKSIADSGYTIIENVFSLIEVNQIISKINDADSSKDTFRKSNDLFAVRQFLKEIPGVKPDVFNEKLKTIISQIFGERYFVVKSIYFDKLELSNWFVSYHQDLTISVDKKMEIPGFGPWTTKQNQFAVQPPIKVLENIYTIRIHLDDTDQNNGALKVIPKSHLKNIYRPKTINWDQESEIICNVQKGGVMIMKPLLLHSSNKTTNNNKRRVLHIEFSDMELPTEIKWSERF